MSRQEQYLIRQFDKLLNRSVKSVLKSVADYEESWLNAAKLEFAKLIPDVPDLSETPVSLKSSLVGAVNMIAIYKAVSKHGIDLASAKELSEKILKLELNRIPKIFLRLSKWFMFTNIAGKMTASAAHKMQTAPVNQFQITYEKLNDQSFEMKVTQCGVCHIARKHNCEEFMPVICDVDKMLSEALGWGLKRTQTIAKGGDHCDFVFRKDAKTQIES